MKWRSDNLSHVLPKRSDFAAFCWAVLLVSLMLGFFAFGPLIAVLFPFTFAFGFALALVTAAPWLYFLILRGTTSLLCYTTGSAVIGALVAIFYGIGAHLLAGHDFIDFAWIPSLLLAVVLALAYWVGAFIFWYHSISEPSKGSG
jgi:hypothetical protein